MSLKRINCPLILSLAVGILCGTPTILRADYAPDGIADLWWTASTAPGKLPASVMALNHDWETHQTGNQTEWQRTLPPATFPAPVLVVASLAANRLDILLDGQLIYSFGTQTAGFATKQAANAVHWVPIPTADTARKLQIRAYALSSTEPPNAPPMILHASSTPLLRYLLRAAVVRIILALLFLFVGIYATLAWAVRRHYGILFSPWLAVLTASLGAGLLIAALMEFLPADIAARIYYIGLPLVLLFPAALWRFMETSLGAGPWKLIRRCWQLQLLAAALLWLPDLLGIRSFGTGAQIVGNSVLALQLGVGAWVGIYHIRTGEAAQRWIALGIFILSLSGLIDIAGALLTGDPTFELYPFGALALVLLLAYVQERAAGEAQRLLRRQAEALHRHQAHLEEQVETRTAQLRESTKAAQAANQAKSDFLANMSHELRTPLNAILGHAQLLRKDTDASNTIRERGDIIQHSGEHLLTLINDLLDLAKIEAGRLDITTANVNLPTLLNGIVEMLKPRAEQKMLTFSMEYTSPIPEVIETDGRRLRQILLNLAGNAIKFTQQGYVRIEVAYQDAQLQVSVHDSGPGLREDETNKIFAAFEQGTIAKNQEGTGLGLSISRRLAQRMGGDIGVDSKPEEGSHFWLRLPCRAIQDPAPGHLKTPRQEPETSSQKTVQPPVPDTLDSDYQPLIEAARIGDLATVQAEITRLRQRHPEDSAILDELERIANNFDIQALHRLLSLTQS